jgi:Xaa-Pro aminopeptidase
MIEELLNREDRRRVSLSQHELERRWKALRERMAAKKVDYLVVQSQQRYVGGYFRWFTDIPGANFHITAIFPLHDEMTIISHNAPTPPTSPPAWALRGVKERINTPAWPNVWWEDAWDAEKAVEVMMRKKPNTVGLVGLGNMSAALYENVKKGLPGVNIVNATDLVDEVRMVKSEEEIKLHREAAYMHEMSYHVAKKATRPGRTATEVIGEIRQAQFSVGSEEQQIGFGFSQPGPGSPEYSQASWGSTFVRQTLREGDIVNLLIESSVPGGYWYDLKRMLCLGPVPGALQEAFEIAKEARDIMAKNCKPGVVPAVALKASDDFLKSKGCPPEGRVGGHGQGLDLVERPVIRPEEPAKFEVGMVLSLHPTARTKHAAASLSDTYVIAESGAVPLYKNLFDDDKIAVVG